MIPAKTARPLAQRSWTPSSRTIWYIILCVHTLLVVYPMFWLLSTSLKNSWEIFKDPWALPTSLRGINYFNAWTKGALGRKLINSVIIDGVALAAILVVASMAAYVLGRFAFRGNRPLYYLFLGGMALPAFLGIVPLFILMTKLGLLNTPHGLVLVYTAYSLPFSIFLLTGFFRTLPHELAEAAIIDGCTPFGVFWRIMLPLAKPGLVTAGTFVFIGLWNEYPLALILLNSETYKTLPLGIADLTMTQKYQSDWGALFAGLAISVAPTVLLYSIFQKQVQAGLTAGAVKG